MQTASRQKVSLCSSFLKLHSIPNRSLTLYFFVLALLLSSLLSYSLLFLFQAEGIPVQQRIRLLTTESKSSESINAIPFIPLSPITEGIPALPLGRCEVSLPPTGSRPVTAAPSDESVAADSGVFDASQENLKASQSNGDLRSRRDFDEDSTETSQVKIGLTYDVDREALVVCIDEAKGLKALGNTTQCKTMYVKAALLPCAPSERCILETKPCNYQENPVFGEQFHIPLAKVRKPHRHFILHQVVTHSGTGRLGNLSVGWGGTNSRSYHRAEINVTRFPLEECLRIGECFWKTRGQLNSSMYSLRRGSLARTRGKLFWRRSCHEARRMVTFPRWMEAPPPKTFHRTRISEPARRLIDVLSNSLRLKTGSNKMKMIVSCDLIG